MVSGILLSLDLVGRVGLETQDAALDKFAIVDDMICLGGEHALDKVIDVAQDDAVSLTAALLLLHRPDLEALQDGDWELGIGPRGIVEDGTGRSSSVLKRGASRRRGQHRTYFRAPLVIWLAASPILSVEFENQV